MGVFGKLGGQKKRRFKTKKFLPENKK